MREIPDAPPVMPVHRLAIADEIEREFGLDRTDPYDEADHAVRVVIWWLRGLCTICGRKPDADPCGPFHAFNARAATDIEAHPKPAAEPPKHIGNRANAEDCPAQPGDPGGPANTHPKETA